MIFDGLSFPMKDLVHIRYKARDRADGLGITVLALYRDGSDIRVLSAGDFMLSGHIQDRTWTDMGVQYTLTVGEGLRLRSMTDQFILPLSHRGSEHYLRDEKLCQLLSSQCDAHAALAREFEPEERP